MRDVNIAGRDVKVINSDKREKSNLLKRALSWFVEHIFTALFVTIIGGITIAFIVFKLGW